jgi:hypothetical protein
MSDKVNLHIMLQRSSSMKVALMTQLINKPWVENINVPENIFHPNFHFVIFHEKGHR